MSFIGILRSERVLREQPLFRPPTLDEGEFIAFIELLENPC
jgi:hypothetical protein